MKQTRALSIVLGIVYYIVGLVGYFYLFIFADLFGMIVRFSSPLFFILFLILPVPVLALPPVLRAILKRPFSHCVLLSLIAVALHALLICGCRFGVIGYMSSFTPEKWSNEEWYSLRYLMVDDLERQYDLVGMTKEEAQAILGEGAEDDDGLWYYVKWEWLDEYYFCLDLDENGVVTDTYKEYPD